MPLPKAGLRPLLYAAFVRIVEEDKISQSAKEFLAEFPGGDVTREQLQMFLEKEDDAADQIMVVFMEDDTVGVKPIKMLTDKMQKLNATPTISTLTNSLPKSSFTHF